MFSLEVELAHYPCPLPPSSPSQIPSYQRLTYLPTSFLLCLMSNSLFVWGFFFVPEKGDLHLMSTFILSFSSLKTLL